MTFSTFRRLNQDIFRQTSSTCNSMISPHSWKQRSNTFRKIKTCDSASSWILNCQQVLKQMLSGLTRSLRTFFRTRLSLQRKERLSSGSMKPITTGNKAIQAWILQNMLWHSRSGILVSVFRGINKISFSKPSNRLKVLRAGNMVVLVSGSLSAVVLQTCSADLSNCRVRADREVYSLSSCQSNTILQ